jgi:hypothetical protein
MAWVGVLLIGGGLVVAGVLAGAWIQAAGGAAYFLLFSWMIREAGQVVRNGLKGRAP